LFKEIPLEQPVRLIGFGVGGLVETDSSQQLDLFDLPVETRRRKEALENTVDQIRQQHGQNAVRKARTLPPGRR
jgi:hypothetical protein